MGAVAALVLAGSLFLEWFSLTETPERAQQGAWLCGTDDFSCSGFEAFPRIRWLLLAASTAPLILAWIVIRDNKLSWPPGEVTTIVGLTATVLIGFNGLLSKPGPQFKFGISLSWGYAIALLAALTIAGAGAWRAMESSEPKRRPAGMI